MRISTTILTCVAAAACAVAVSPAQVPGSIAKTKTSAAFSQVPPPSLPASGHAALGAFSAVPPPSLADPAVRAMVFRAAYAKLDAVRPPGFSKVPGPSPGATRPVGIGRVAAPTPSKPPATVRSAVAPAPVVVITPPVSPQKPVAIQPAPAPAQPTQKTVQSAPVTAAVAPAPRPATTPAAPQPNTIPAKTDKVMAETKARERAAMARAGSRPMHGAMAAARPSSSAVLEAPPLPISAAKQMKLSELLVRYKADEITPEQYQKARAAILAEPEK